MKTLQERLNAEIQASKDEGLHNVGEHLLDLSFSDPAFAVELELAMDEEQPPDAPANKKAKKDAKSGQKTLANCWEYIVSNAEKRKSGRCAAIKHTEVYEWAYKYYGVTPPKKSEPQNYKRLEFDIDALLA
jgi:hypothetical protein